MKIKDYENYEVTCGGEVINTKRGKVLKPGNNGKGYLRVVLSKDNKQKNFLIHRLVAEAFIPNPDNLPCVNHKDENPLNNNVENLEWCTCEYNIQYSKNKPILQLMKDGSLVRIWPSTAEIHRQLHFNQSSISKCCLGERHTAYGFKWCYAKK